MSLDFYLIVEKKIKKEQSSGIFIRENGETKEISEEEWNKRFPDKEPVKFNLVEGETNEVFDANITHNLGEMADKAGIYYVLWHPNEKGWKKAKDIIEILEKGFKELKDNPKKYQKYNPKNGWGDYNGLVRFTERCLKACKEYPNAKIYTST